MTLFKYTSSQYATKFIREGEILFRTIAYFRDYEDEQIRGDKYDGTRLYAKKTGLRITKQDTGETVDSPFSFESCVKADEIFVFCMSLVHDKMLYEKFNSDVCVEITARDKFILRVKNALKLRPTVKPKNLLLHGPVKYYREDDAPIIDWALPERIVMSKLQHFAWQNEYRLAFSIREALSFGKTKQYLVSSGATRKEATECYPFRIIKVGNLDDIAMIHKNT